MPFYFEQSTNRAVNDHSPPCGCCLTHLSSTTMETSRKYGEQSRAPMPETCGIPSNPRTGVNIIAPTLSKTFRLDLLRSPKPATLFFLRAVQHVAQDFTNHFFSQ